MDKFFKNILLILYFSAFQQVLSHSTIYISGTVTDKNNDPLIYKLVYDDEYPLYDNPLPIHRKVYDKANMDLYEIHLKVKRLNPNCKFVGIKTYCLVYNNVTTEIETSDKWGDVK